MLFYFLRLLNISSFFVRSDMRTLSKFSLKLSKRINVTLLLTANITFIWEIQEWLIINLEKRPTWENEYRTFADETKLWFYRFPKDFVLFLRHTAAIKRLIIFYALEIIYFIFKFIENPIISPKECEKNSENTIFLHEKFFSYLT